MALGIDKRIGRYSRRDVALGAAALAAAAAAGLLPLSLAAGLLAGPLLLVLCFLDPVWGLYLLVLSVPLQEFVLLPGGLTATQFIAGLTLLSWILQMLMRRDVQLPSPLLLPWIIYLFALMLGAAFASYSVDQSIKELGRWLAAFLAFELTVAHITTRRRAFGLAACLLIAPLAAALVGLWQFATGTGPESFQIGPYVRAYGPFGKPNPLAGYLNMAWPLAAALALGLFISLAPRREGSGRPLGRGQIALRSAAVALCGLCALTLLAAEAATYSRGGWLGTIAGLLTMAALAWGRPGPRTIWSAILLGVLLLALVLGGRQYLPAGIGSRIDSIVENVRIFDAAQASVNDENFAIVERMAHWQAGWRMFQTHPLLGVGPGNYYLAYKDFFVGRWYITQGHAHNYYIHIAAEAGIIGFLAYLLLIASVARQALRAVTAADTTFARALAVGGCGIIAAVMMHNVFENLHVLNMGIQLSAVWGLQAWIVGRQVDSQGGHNP
ncbi:MAG: O-antigen polymerase [Herpetosiphonaceae bacterium]|nr:MAG: O-antigen polymerase [Herpetosiphonaceae bacterium]